MDILRKFRPIQKKILMETKARANQIRYEGNQLVQEYMQKYQAKTETKLEKITTGFERKRSNLIAKEKTRGMMDQRIKILKTKKALIQDFLVTLKGRIQDWISKHYDAYFDKLMGEIQQNLSRFPVKGYLVLNERDKTRFIKNSLSRFDSEELVLAQEVLKDVGGFQLTNRDRSICLDHSIQNTIALQEKAIQISLGEIFPAMEDL